MNRPSGSCCARPTSCGCGWSAPSPTPCAGWSCWRRACSPGRSRTRRWPSPPWWPRASCRSSCSAPSPAPISEAVNRKLIVHGGADRARRRLDRCWRRSPPPATSNSGTWRWATCVSGTMWATEMSTRRRMVGEVAGPHRIVNAIALDSATSAATRMIGPLLGGIAFEMAGHERRLHAHRPRPVRRRLRDGGPRRIRRSRDGSTSRASRPRSPRAWRFARTKPTILLVFGITIVTNAFAFAYSGLVAPLGAGAFDVSPALVGLLAAGEPLGALAGRRADRGRRPAHGPPPRLRRRCCAVHGGADRDGAVAVLLARLRRARDRRLRHGGLRQHAIDPDADRGAARDALAADGHRHGLHRHRPARRPGRRRALRPDRPARRGDGDGGRSGFS